MVSSVEQQQIPEGYKQTEVGVIPEDWKIYVMGCIFKITAGGDLRKSEYSDERTQEYSYPIYSNALSNEGLYGFCLTYDYDGNFITITARGGIGHAEERNDRFCVIGRLLVLEPVKEMNCKFVTEYINQYLSFANESTGVPQLTAPQVSQYKVVMPLEKEQTAIANALSDVDALVNSLEKLIAKKCAIKTATIQQLLTGKKRLPPFNETHTGYKKTELGEIPEDWEVDSIGRVLSITTGDKNTQDKVDDGQYPFFVRSQTIECINSYSFDGEAVLTAGDGVGTGKIFHYVNGKFDYHQRVYLMHNFCDRLDGYYFYIYFSNNFYNRIMSMTAKSSVDSVRREMIADMEIILPTIDEQIQISKALTDMDQEIMLLEQRLNKTQQLKQGMMQELLTGRTRLL